MTITLSDAAFWLALVGPALIGIGVIGEYVAAAIHQSRKKGL